MRLTPPRILLAAGYALVFGWIYSMPRFQLPTLAACAPMDTPLPPVIADKFCSAEPGAATAQLRFHPDRCASSRACRATLAGTRLQLLCDACTIALDLWLGPRATLIDLPRFLDGMEVSFALTERGERRWLALRDVAGELVLLAVEGPDLTPPDALFSPLRIERRPEGHVLEHAGNATFVPHRTDCVSADGAFYFLDAGDVFLAYATRAR